MRVILFYLCKCLKVIILSDFIFLLVAAYFARVHEYKCIAFLLYECGAHEAATGSFSVTWINVYMLAPHTCRAMVGIAIATHLSTTVFADEIFLFFDESHSNHDI